MRNIDYSEYTIDELYEVRDHIDAEQYPERYQSVLNEIELKKVERPELLSAKKPKKKFDYNSDPISKKTRWVQATSGGANFVTHRLLEINNQRVKFKAPLSAKLTLLIFSLIGLIAIFVFSQNVPSFHDSEKMNIWIVSLAIGAIFILLPSYLYYSNTKPIIFDKLQNKFWKSRNEKGPPTIRALPSEVNKISNIYAIQLISGTLRDLDSDYDYTCYELNLVLKDGSRFNVTVHNSDADIKEDAKLLSKFLNVPIWDNIDEES